MATADALLTWARAQLGTTEKPAGSNKVRYWDDVMMSGAQGAPWCAAFVLAGLERVGAGPVTRSVYVPRIIQDYRGVGRLYPISKAEPGDQVLYMGSRFPEGHTGIVESIDPVTRTVVALEGNTSAGVVGSQNDGGGVYRRTRPWSDVVGVGRPKFDPSRRPTIGEVMARFPNAVDACMAPNGGVWVLGTDGGVGHYGGAPAPTTGPVSYPGLPAEQRQGDRAFLRIMPSTRPGKLYDCLADDGSAYSF